ncbi:MAG: hypothetical protein ABEJ67_00835 [Halanaeroarchaeum sp.]
MHDSARGVLGDDRAASRLGVVVLVVIVLLIVVAMGMLVMTGGLG